MRSLGRFALVPLLIVAGLLCPPALAGGASRDHSVEGAAGGGCTDCDDCSDCSDWIGCGCCTFRASLPAASLPPRPVDLHTVLAVAADPLVRGTTAEVFHPPRR